MILNKKSLELDPNLHNFEQEVKSRSFFGQLQIILQYIYNDIRTKPRSFKIGLFTVFLVIGFITSLQSCFQLAPIIFVKLSEDTVGDADFTLIPISYGNQSDYFTSLSSSDSSSFASSILSNINLLNQTYISEKCETMDEIVGSSSRWMLLGNLSAPNSITPNVSYKAYIIAGNSVLERSFGLGRRLDAPLLDNSEVLLTAPTARGLGIKTGDNLTLNIDFTNDFLGSSEYFNISDGDNATEAINSYIVQIIDEQYSETTGSEGTFSVNTTQIREVANALYEIEPNNEQIKQFKELADSLPEDYEMNSTVIADVLTPIIVNSMNVTLNLTLKQAIENPKGKWPNQIGHTVFMDIQSFSNLTKQQIIDNFETQYNQTMSENSSNSSSQVQILQSFINFTNISFVDVLTETLEAFNLEEESLLSDFVLKDRMKIYQNANAIKNYFIAFSNKLYKILGKTHKSSPEITLAESLEEFLMVKLFLDNMISAAIFILLILSILLIYSLMISNVDEKTYEFGMLRALGFKKQSLVIILVIQSLSFSVLGIIFGMIFSQLINFIVSYIVFQNAMLITKYHLHNSAIIMGLLIGFIMPFISNYIPITRALSKSLRDSLDLYHRTLAGFIIQIQKLEKLGISFSQFICSITLVFMGIICYYFAPSAYITENMALFLAIINIILILMIIGFTLIGNLSQNFFENLIIQVILCFFKKDRVLKQVIMKNKESHQRRNFYTSLMYTVALSFLIFAGTAFNLQGETIRNVIKMYVASDIQIYQPDYDTEFLDEVKLRESIKAYMKQYPDHIQDYSFVTPVISMYPKISTPSISPLSQFPSANVYIQAVESNFLNSVYLDFYIPTMIDSSFSLPILSNGEKDVVLSLYSKQGNQNLSDSLDYYKIQSNSLLYSQYESIEIDDEEVNILLPAGIKNELSISVNTPSLIELESMDFRTKVRALLKKLPGFYFSSYRSAILYTQGIVSMESYKYIIDQFIERQEIYSSLDTQFAYKSFITFINNIPEGSSYGLPKQFLYVKFAKELNLHEREILENNLKVNLNQNTIIVDLPSLIEKSSSTLVLIQLFSYVVAIVAIILSFFLILVSYISNIKENSWEFGILRSIGLNKTQITKVYIYEALSLILSSSIIGSFIGILVACAMTIEILMFLEINFIFLFPIVMFCLVFSMGIVISILGSYYAIKLFKDQQISQIVKGLI